MGSLLAQDVRCPNTDFECSHGYEGFTAKNSAVHWAGFRHCDAVRNDCILCVACHEFDL